jgi:hypothetical protein
MLSTFMAVSSCIPHMAARSDEMSLRPNLYVVAFGGHRSAPRVRAALAGVVHNPAGHEHNRDEDNQ